MRRAIVRNQLSGKVAVAAPHTQGPFVVPTPIIYASHPLALVAAAALPPLLAYNQTPAVTLYNQLLALAGWGLVLWLWARGTPGWRAGLKSPAAVALALLAVAPLTSVAWRALPLSVGLDAFAVIGAGLAVLLLAQGLGAEARRKAAEALCWGLLVAGLCSVAISIVQVFAPDLADGNWIARYGIAGRASAKPEQEKQPRDFDFHGNDWLSPVPGIPNTYR